MDLNMDTEEPVSVALSQTGVIILIVIGCSLVCITAVVLIFVVSRRYCREDSVHLLAVNDGICTKSAPSTRNSSPILNRSTSKKSIMMRSLTVDLIQDINLPVEKVQPIDDNLLPKKQNNRYNHITSDHINSKAEIFFSIQYSQAISQVTIHVIRATNLPPPCDGRTGRNPYIRVSLLPGEDVHESQLIKNSLAPRFDETVAFKINENDLNSKSIRISVYDLDVGRRIRHSLGYINVLLNDSALLLNDVTLCRKLENKTG